MKSGLGWVSLMLALGIGALIRLMLFPLMVLGFMKLATLEAISIPLSVAPIAVGAFGIRRGSTRVIPFIGVTLGLILLLWLIMLNFVTINIHGLS